MKTTVAVFFGGRSTEHEISVISANQAMHAINRERFINYKQPKLSVKSIANISYFFFRIPIRFGSNWFKSVQIDSLRYTPYPYAQN